METPAKQQRHARFWKKFLRLTRGRVPVLRTLHISALEAHDEEFQAVLSTVHKDVEEGATLSEAIARHPEEFSLSIVELVKTAEGSGAWDEILDEIADGLAEGTFD